MIDVPVDSFYAKIFTMKAKLFTILSLLFLYLYLIPAFAAECVDVRGRGKTSINNMQCTPVKTTELLETVCYDSKNAYMLLNVAGQYFEYCGIKELYAEELLKAKNKGDYINSHIAVGVFDCTIFQPPNYAGQCK